MTLDLNDESITSVFEIKLNEENKIYELNDTITGVLTLKINSILEAKRVIIKLKCVGQVQWLLPQFFDSQINSNCLIKERENFLNTNYDVEKNYNELIKPGLHKIWFCFYLKNKDLPPSFKEDNGSICYYLTASIIDIESGKPLIKTLPIIIDVKIGTIRNDLNLSVGANATKQFAKLCLGKKKIQIYAFISKKGYFPGEKVSINFHIINESSHKLNSKLTLYQTKCFFCKNRQHIVEHHYEEINGFIISKEKESKETIVLKIPENCDLSFKTSIILVKYFINILVNINKSTTIYLNLPITLTTQKCLNQLEV